MSWLDCETSAVGAKKIVDRLKCKVCIKFKSKIAGRRNYSDKWVVGADSVRTSNIKDHSRMDQHKHAMMLLKKEHAESLGHSVTSYAPIAKALHELPADTKAQLRVKFDIARFVATEKLSFSKYWSICELETRHGVDVGNAYINENAGKSFCHFIAESRREELAESLSNAKFFSLLMDGSTDKGNVDDELVHVLWCDIAGTDEKVHTRMSLFAVARPREVTAVGLFECLQSSLGRIGIAAIDGEQCKKLIGIGTDGAAANIASAGLKGLVEEKTPWIFWMWCLAHRLELAIKDALKTTSFDLIDDMLFRLHLINEKSPKKCRELEEVIAELRQCLQFDDAGIRPVRASGSRWVTHKLSAMKRVLSKFGVYTSHLTIPSEDRSIKAGDRAKVSGYCKKWADAKYLLGCALFVDLLTPCSIFSKVIQKDDLDVLGAFTSLLRTVKEVNKLSSKSLEHWPTYTATMKITQEGGERVYQCQAVQNFDQPKRHYTTHHPEYCSSVTSCLKSRLEWSDLQLVRDVIFVLATQGWQKILDEEGDPECEHDSDGSEKMDSIEPIHRLGERFKVPLEAAGVNIGQIHEESQEMLLYAIQFISLATIEYQAVWWRLFHSPNASEWSNILILVQLLFTFCFKWKARKDFLYS